jgi:predicted metal-dependent peptidase
VDYSVPIDWFSHLKNSVFNITQKYTSNYEQTWSRLKNKFRHIAPMPGRIYLDKQLAAIISIDQSGSMSDKDLEKINYVVSELAKKAVFVEILLHDTRVAERKRFDKKSPLNIREFITNRVACGGTSHQEVFQIVDEIKTENKKRKLIYLSFSDNWSDIDQVYDPAVFDKITAYWVTTDESRLVNVPGMQISLEHGLLQH